jgi:hypothetical protein
MSPPAEKPCPAAGGIKKFADNETREGKIKTVEILKVEMRGEGAKVLYKIRYQGGQTKQDDASLIKENVEWKITGWSGWLDRLHC